MRDIKFRAWDASREEFIYSSQISGDMWRYFKTLEDRGIRHFESQQFTGLHDKNGKEIYEGDILRYPSGERIRVIWMGYPAAFSPMEDTGNTEIIGNIYENPELLK